MRRWLQRLLPTPRSAKNPDEEAVNRVVELLREGRDGIDHLGKAAMLGEQSRRAVKEGRYDEAWGLIHDQKMHYLAHAKNYGMTARQTLALDGTLHVQLANIRRLEGKHDDALVHVIYAGSTREEVPASPSQKLRAYFNRCKFKKTTLDDASAFVALLQPNPSLRAAQLKVMEWRERE